MQLTVLVDNNTLIDRYLLAEPGVSFLIRDDDTTLLFDVGYSGVFLHNARTMGLSLAHLDYVVLSHGHLDHTWGLDTLIRHHTELSLEKVPHSRPVIVAHPETFTSVSEAGFAEFGTLLSAGKLARHFTLHLSERPQRLGARLVYLGQVPRRNAFESIQTFGRKESATEDDVVIEDSALVFESSEGLVIITGCSHAGICNIIDHATDVCGDRRIADVIGGLHLQNPSPLQLEGTLACLERIRPAAVHACHCTDLPSKIALSRVVPLHEVGVGQVLTWQGR